MEEKGRPRIRVYEGIFDPGQVTGTKRSVSALERARISPSEIIQRHILGDWGDVEPDHRAENDSALVSGGSIVSVYYLAVIDETIWVITKADRSSTRILLFDEC